MKLTGKGIEKAILLVVFTAVLVAALFGDGFAAAPAAVDGDFPPDLQQYGDAATDSLPTILANRIRQEPFNLAAALIFLGAIIHTFLTSRFMAVAHRWEHAHAEKIRRGEALSTSVHHGAELFHFLGEVEVVFGLWAIFLVAAIVFFHDWSTAVGYLAHRVNFTEALFVMVIMTLAATRAILKISEQIMRKIASWLGGSLTAWWLTILTLGPVLGSFITEPAAMTISALLLARKFYDLDPSPRLKYATLGLLFVNISVGGTLTHFAAPPVLMVAAPWNWDTAYMISHFGWKAVVGILIANGIYFIAFRRELSRLQRAFAVQELKDTIQSELFKRRELKLEIKKIGTAISRELGFTDKLERQTNRLIEQVKSRLEADYLPQAMEKGYDAALIREAFDKRFEEIKLNRLRRNLPGLLPEEQQPPFVDPDWDRRDDPVPAWVTACHIFFMGWTIFNAHHPELFIPGLLFFLGFSRVTAQYQNRIDLKPALLVGFFLGGLVTHGGVQGWWIEPVLGSLSELPLMVGATVLTAFNDNAAITFLSTLVPGFTDSLKYAVVAGAVAGGGLTVIANAPNPAGQSLLKRYFDEAVSPLGILAGALVPTVVVWLAFLFL
jgi:hypothetical protein